MYLAQHMLTRQRVAFEAALAVSKVLKNILKPLAGRPAGRFDTFQRVGAP
jgi:hypothetical protein